MGVGTKRSVCRARTSSSLRVWPRALSLRCTCALCFLSSVASSFSAAAACAAALFFFRPTCAAHPQHSRQAPVPS